MSTRFTSVTSYLNYIKRCFVTIPSAIPVVRVYSSSSSEGLFEVRRPKCEEGSPEVLIREGLEELTLRAEEVGTQKSCINVDHIAQERWGSPLVDADCHAFCQAIYKGIEG